MSIRQGLTAAEENKLKTLISQGKSWEYIVSLCSLADERGREQEPLFDGVNLDHIKKHIYDPLVKKLEEAKKQGHKSIHEFESKTAAKLAAERAKKRASEGEE
jgi:hypothetical protein